MTTTVKVTAHCSSDKEVKIVIKDTVAPEQNITLQGGDSIEVYAYDDRQIVIKEVLKNV